MQNFVVLVRILTVIFYYFTEGVISRFYIDFARCTVVFPGNYCRFRFFVAFSMRNGVAFRTFERLLTDINIFQAMATVFA